MRIIGCILLIGVLSAYVAAAEPKGPFLSPPPMQFYEQTFELTLSSSEAAAKAKAAILPLYEGKKWAITCRWDDTNAGFNTQLSALMKKHGIRGTFYLTGTDKWEDNGKEHQMVKSILADGNSIGSHGWTHGMLGIMSVNRTFEELLRCRIQLEDASDTPVCSHAFAYMSYGNDFERADSRKFIGQSLFRSGMYTLGESVQGSQEWPFLMPHPYYISSDGYTPEKVKEYLDKLLASPTIPDKNPCLAFSIHPGAHQNADTEGKCFDLVAGKPEYWFCTQDQYGAYRIQFHMTKMTSSVKGNVLKVVLSRPSLVSLNNPIPITVAVPGVAPAEVREIKVPDALIERQDVGNEVRFNLPHARTQMLPAKIDWIANEENAASLDAAKHRSQDFPGLSGILWKDGESLKWQLKNETGSELTNINALYRLPIAYKNGNRMVEFNTLASGALISQTESLANAPGADPRYFFGNPFLALEINFTQGEKRGRLYLTTFTKYDHTLDQSYPQGGFLRIGPIPKSQYVPQMAEDLAAGKTNHVTLKDGSVLPLRPIEMVNTATNRGSTSLDLHPEMVYTTGRPSLRSAMKNDGVWIYRSTVQSEKQEEAIYRPTFYPNKTYDLNKKTVYVNGKKLEDGRFTLNAGKNDVIVVFETWSKSDALSAQNAGFFFQIISATSKKRIPTIQYVLPDEKRVP